MIPVIRRALTCAVAVGLLHGAGLAQANQYRVSGVVQDGANGYLQGARVFFDMNGNGTYDIGEPSNMSDAQGAFSLKSNDAGASQAPIVAEVPVITPKGKDTRQVDAPFTLAAPASHPTVLNPQTTLVHGRMATTGESATEAAAHYAGLLGLSGILDSDYVAMNDGAARDVAGPLAALLTAAQGTVADAVTDKARLKMLIAVANEVSLAAAAQRSLASLVVTRGGIFAATILADAATNPRNVPANPGEVVVHAGLGYHKTLFDSADNNCQHCHNDLYDTWKKSMHANSWKDPIFQTLYQDFLRMGIARIGVSGPTGTYSEQTFKGVAQTCIRCHAPAAYYSNDFDVQLKVLSENPLEDYASLKATQEFNKPPAYDPNQVGKVVSLSATGKVYQASYHVGNKHNREGISCAVCHGIETVRLNNDIDGDFGQYKLANALKAGPIGPVVYPAGSILEYSWDSMTPDMNAFFMLTGPEKYADPGNTPKDAADFDQNKLVDGRYTMKSTPLGKYTGGPYYGPWGVSGLHNVRADDTLDRHALVNPHFGGDHPDLRDQHFKKQSKSLCLGCHQRSASALNPEFNGLPGVQVGLGGDQFMELCTTWSVASTAPEANYNAKPDSPQCTNCHMERIDNKTALHKWDAPDQLYTAEDGMTGKWDPENPDGIAARGYMANHAFVGGEPAKLESAIEAAVAANANGAAVKVTTTLLNKTGHEFPAAHPMRRALTRVVVTDATGKKIPYVSATGASSHENIVNTIATSPGETVYPGREQVGVKYNAARVINIPGMEDDLVGEPVVSQQYNKMLVTWMDAAYGTVVNPVPFQKPDGSWTVKGEVYANKIVDSGDTSNFTRIYGHETSKKDPVTGTHLVRPGFDSNIVRDNRLLTNERETYVIDFDATQVDAWPVTVDYRVYYLKKGSGGAFPTTADGFLDKVANQNLKLGIREIFRQAVEVTQ